MNSQTTRAELSKELLDFLEQRGYRYILSIGASASEDYQEGTKDDYRIIPLKADDPRLTYEETDYGIDPIKSNDVLEMAAGDEFIRFMIEIPVEDYTYYLNQG